MIRYASEIIEWETGGLKTVNRKEEGAAKGKVKESGELEEMMQEEFKELQEESGVKVGKCQRWDATRR